MLIKLSGLQRFNDQHKRFMVDLFGCKYKFCFPYFLLFEFFLQFFQPKQLKVLMKKKKSRKRLELPPLLITQIYLTQSLLDDDVIA